MYFFSTIFGYYLDISENLFRLQIGGQKHWNVYTKSFLSFGQVSARERHLAMIADSAIASNKNSVENPCFHSGYSEKNQGSTGVNGLKLVYVTVSGPNSASDDQFEKCLATLRPLLNKVNSNGIYLYSVLSF